MSSGSQARDNGSKVVPNVFQPNSTTTQKINSAGSSTQSTAFAADTICRIVADADCHYAIGTNPTATTSSIFLPSKSGEQIQIKNGNKIAVIGTVNLYVTPLGT